jgi:hypothetical protein
MAYLGTGEILKDSATLYFDPRPPQELGTAGPYTWIDLKFVPDGKIAISAGDSSPARDGSFGFWKKTGASVSGEIFVPYGILGTVAWPESGDLGLSLVWRHVPEVGKNTTLMWAENGHPWNPRWFGVVRLNPKGPLPYRVRVE